MTWRLPAWPCLILPFAVNLKRFLALDLVFILGICVSYGPRWLGGWGPFASRVATACPFRRAARRGRVLYGKDPERQARADFMLRREPEALQKSSRRSSAS